MKAAPEQYRCTKEDELFGTHKLNKNFATTSEDGNTGMFYLPRQGKTKGRYFLCKVSDGMGWEHVSVSIPTERRCPTWEEMCYIKDTFWSEDETVVQYHPPKSEYVSNHEHCLHLWRPTDQDLPRPNPILVGIPNK